MYTLTLTKEERAAIDWVGYRYGHGDELYGLLNDITVVSLPIKEWGDEGDITFSIPEHIAWQIRDIGEECSYLWDCFSEEFSAKLNKFCDQIV